MLGLYDTVTIKSKNQTTDGRGGVTTTLSVKIASLVCSIQPIRREEFSVEQEGMEIIDPWILMFENISSGPSVDVGDIVQHGVNTYLIINVGTTSGLGTHTECILKSISSDAHLA